MVIAVVIVWALALGMSPGLALIALAVVALVVDRCDPSLLGRLLGPSTPSEVAN